MPGSPCVTSVESGSPATLMTHQQMRSVVPTVLAAAAV